MFKGRKSGHLKKVDDRMQYQVERVKSWRFKMRGKDLLTLAWLCFFFLFLHAALCGWTGQLALDD